ncbi:hypothetical protein [Herpetosiphon gulosus]|uniref:Uncharacterized protein n=1 Tax=Herpetosiphon gulosus TaxID=1973496 RepID=A0ABP9X778_9CHLR
MNTVNPTQSDPHYLILRVNDPHNWFITEFQQTLADHIHILETVPRKDLNDVKLVVEIVNHSVNIAASVAAILTLLWAARDRAARLMPQPDINITTSDGKSINLAHADQELLKSLLGIDDQ